MNLYLITGTGSGLGLALAKAVLARDGDELVCLSRHRAKGLEAARFHQTDLREPRTIDGVFDAIAKEIGTRTYDKAVLINNAGVIDPVGAIETLDTEALIGHVNVNLVSAMIVTRRFLALTEGRAKVRRIINISSGLGRRAMFGTAAYCTTKAGLDMFSRVAALEAQTNDSNVEVLSLAPGIIDTPMQDAMRELSPEALPDVGTFREFHTSGALSSADNVAADILKLEAAGFRGIDPIADIRKLVPGR